ncbi:MAG: hypothetical protein ACYSVY_20360, partial [Planctomycetota bacterium]
PPTIPILCGQGGGFFPGIDKETENNGCCEAVCHPDPAGGHDHCVVPPECPECPGACCLHDGTCQGNMPEQDCLALGGNWDERGDCNDPAYVCPTECFWDNGPPLDDWGAPASQYDWDYPFSAEAADDFILKGDPANWCQLWGVTTWVTHFNFDPSVVIPDPGIWKAVTVTIYADTFQPKGPAGNREDDGTFTEYFPGGLVYTVTVPNDGSYNWFPLPIGSLPCIEDVDGDGISDVFQIDIPLDVKLPKDVKYWLVIQPELSEFQWGFGQTAILLSQVNHEHPAQQIFPLAGIPAWQNITGNTGTCPGAPPAGTRTDLAFILWGEKIPEPWGACCWKSQGYPVCTDNTTQQFCEVNLGGTWEGPWTTCPTEGVQTAVHNGQTVLHVVDPTQTCGQGSRSGDCPPEPTDSWRSPEGGGSVHDFTSNPLPAGFFEPGSDPFDGQVSLEGQPLGTKYDPADTLVVRADDPFGRCELPSPDERTIPAEIVALSLVSSSPIVVTYNGGLDPEDWDVAVGLSVVSPPIGSITAVKDHCNGGTYTSLLSVLPKFTFTRVSDGQVREWDTGLEGLDPIELSLPSGGDPDPAWTHDVDPLLGLPLAECSDFHPSIEDAEPGPCPTIVGAVSCHTHGAAGEWCMPVETRNTGVHTLEIGWSGPLDDAAGMGVVSVVCDGVPYAGATSVSVGGPDTIRVEFAPALPDESCCVVHVAGCRADDSVNIGSVAGDISGDGVVTVSDKALIKLQIGQPVTGANYWYDMSGEGDITLSDKSQIKPKIGNSLPPPCP